MAVSYQNFDTASRFGCFEEGRRPYWGQIFNVRSSLLLHFAVACSGGLLGGCLSTLRGVKHRLSVFQSVNRHHCR
jgi:hypothetical protein